MSKKIINFILNFKFKKKKFKKIINFILYNFLYKLLDSIYIILDKRHVRRTKNIDMIPSAFSRRGGTYSYAEWSYIIGIFQTIISNNLRSKTDLQILDVGCGAGLMLNSVRQFVGSKGNYIGIESSEGQDAWAEYYNEHDPTEPAISEAGETESSDEEEVDTDAEESAEDAKTDEDAKDDMNEDEVDATEDEAQDESAEEKTESQE